MILAEKYCVHKKIKTNPHFPQKFQLLQKMAEKDVSMDIDSEPNIKIKKEPMEEDTTEDESDPIVKEIPVFLSQTLAQNLLLFQYPVRPSNLPYDRTTTSVLDAKFKPEQQKVQLTLGINTSCANYDTSKGEQIALNVDGTSRKSEEEKTFREGIMDKISLSSTKAIKNANNYAVGIYNGSELHLTPIRGVVSLKPSLNYLDKGDKTAKAEGRPQLNESSQDEDEDEPTEKVQKVGVRFQRNAIETDKVKEMKKKSFEHQKKLEEEEAWVNMEYHHVKSDEWVAQTHNLFCKKLDGLAIEGGSAKINEYINELKDS